MRVISFVKVIRVIRVIRVLRVRWGVARWNVDTRNQKVPGWEEGIAYKFALCGFAGDWRNI